MKLTVVGCSGSFPGPESPASSYLLEHDGTRILLDLGNGALGHLQRYTDLYEVDGVVLSHLHVDHFIDLCSYYVALKYCPGGPARRLPVWGPQDTGERLVAAYGRGVDEGILTQFDVRRLEDTFSVGPFQVTIRRMVHPVEAYALRVEAGGSSLTYSGDTGPTSHLPELARGTDLALFEASFLSDQPNPADLHMTGRDAGKAAAAADAERLVLTHLVPWHPVEQVLAEAQEQFSDAQLAVPGLTLDL